MRRPKLGPSGGRLESNPCSKAAWVPRSFPRLAREKDPTKLMSRLMQKGFFFGRSR